MKVETMPDAAVPASADDEPTRALFKAQQAKVDAQAWAERVRTATTEVLDAEEVADIRSHVGQGAGVSQQMVRLLCDSHERLRAGVSPQPEITRQQIQEAIHDAYVGSVDQPSFLTVASMWKLTDAVWALLADGATPRDDEQRRAELLAQVEERRTDTEFMDRLAANVERNRPILDRLADGATPAGPDGASLITAERRRQVDAEGWTPEHDDEHRSGELIAAAVSYAQAADPDGAGERAADIWPFVGGFKPSDDPVRNLVRAGALLAAEIDRLQRVGATPAEDDQP